jgi:hypothetical protein
VDMQTGKILWQTSTNILHGDPGTNTPYGVWPLWTFTCGSIADGILFVPEGHMYSPPLFRGAKELAINTTDGSLVWSILGFDTISGPAIADGYMTTLDCYDNQIYTFGKGPTLTTVGVQPFGSKIVISGSICDISAGSSQDAVTTNFPHGLPCVSDESMSAWMEYIYKQQQYPTDATGVQIALNVMDANGNYRTIGTTISDLSGKFTYTWEPDIPGDYTVIASFAGTESYFGSSDETFFTVSEPTATPAPMATPQASLADLYFVPMSIGIIVAIVLVGAAVILLQRKHP